MSESQAQNNKKGSGNPKSIPEHIIDGSIAIDSIEAFGSILKQFPDIPALKKKYADLLFKQNLLDLAAKSYGEAALLFMESGKMLQALVSKKLQWLIKPPPNKEIHQFLSALSQKNFEESPLKQFFDKLSPREMLAVISGLVRVRLIAGKTVLKAGDKETDLYFIVSGTLKDSAFPSLETKEKIHRKSNIYLSDDNFFGEVYPFKNDKTCTSDIETVTQVELVKISRQKLIKLSRHCPNIEVALMYLFKVRSSDEAKDHLKYLRQADRYQLPIKMILEIPPTGPFKSPIAIEGYSSDISIGGICVVLNGSSEHVPDLLNSLASFNGNKQIKISFPGDTMELKVQGNIVWSHQISFNGKKTLAVGIQFQENSPKMRGMLFMFARSLGGTDTVTGVA
jgi:CRP-like cAMP-binding protein